MFVVFRDLGSGIGHGSARCCPACHVCSKIAIGCMALHDAVDNIDAVRALIRGGEDVNARDANGDTPLHYAAIDDHLHVARALIAAKADLDAKGQYGRTPLMEAAHFASVSVLQELLALKANIHTVPPPLHVVLDAMV